LEESPSLQEISSRLYAIEHLPGDQTEQVLQARGVITRATTDLHLYLNKAFDCVEEKLQEQVVGTKDASDADSASSCSTEFEDIDEYCEPIDPKYEDCMQFEDNASVTSARTI
tara:strand:- start:8841 stop:9179 length:339 start_codon:yes stop_codon:yes gene_type:complete